MKHRARRLHPLRPVFTRHLRSLEHAPETLVSDYQERRLRSLVRLAARRSPYYRRWFAESGTDSREIRTLADLSRLPLLTRSDLAERAEEFCTRSRSLMWECSSSGTSGRRITAYRTAGSSVFELVTLAEQWRWFGLGPAARRVVLRGSWVPEVGADVVRPLPGAHQLMLSSYHLTPQHLERMVGAVREFGADAVEGWPSSLALLAGLLRDRGVRLPVRAVITSSEAMSPPQRALLEEVFDAPIVDHYGQTERVAMTGTCETGSYHIFSAYGIVELLPVDGDSERLEIVGTPLHNRGFPLFRYRTGDEVVPISPGPCPCGRRLPVIGAVAGRVEEVFVGVDRRPIPLPSMILDNLVNVRESQIAQLAAGRFEVRLVPGRDFDAASTESLVRANADHYFGPGQQVEVRTVTELPRAASGKLKPVVVEGV